MTTGELKSKIDRIWHAFWSGGISKLREVIEQITYLLFIRWWSSSTPDGVALTADDQVTEADTAPSGMSFDGLEVGDDAVVGDDTELALYDSTALLGPVAKLPRSIRTALSRTTDLRDGRRRLVVCTPSGEMIHRSLAPGSEAEARTFAARLNAASAELRRS